MIQAALTEQSVCIGLYNVLVAAMAANLTVSHQAVPMMMSQEKLVPIYLCVGLQKNSIYTKTFNTFTSIARETGLWRKWRDDNFGVLKNMGMHWLSNEMKDSELRELLIRMWKERKTASQLRLEHFSVVFGILGVGVLFASILFIAEVANEFITRMSNQVFHY